MKRNIFSVLIMLGILLLIGACAGTKSAKISISPSAVISAAAKSASKKPATAEPAAEKPAAVEPAAEKPVTAEPVAEKPPILSLPVATGSNVSYDDKIGFEEFPFIMDENTVTTIEGDIRRIFTQDPEGKSPLAMIRLYEEAVKNMGGEILFKTRTPKEEEMGGKKLTEHFKTHRIDRGLGTNQFTFTAFPGGDEKEGITEFLSAVVKKGTAEMYVYVASGKGAWAASTLANTYTEIITVNK